MLCNPVLHSRLGLKCPCFVNNPTYGNKGVTNERETTTLSQVLSPRDKELLKPKIIEVAFQEDSFVQDWKGWTRHVWNIGNFFGTAPLIVTGDHINGFNLIPAFVGRLGQIVSSNRGLVVSGDKSSKLVLSFEGDELYNVQFSVMALRDHLTVLVDGVPPVGHYCIMGRKVRNQKNEFIGDPSIPDYEGTADLLFKFEQVKKVELTFSNRLVLTDILYKK